MNHPAGEAGTAANFHLRAVAGLPHTFDPGRTPTALRLFEREPDWRMPHLIARYPRLSTDREVADERNLEWVTPGHPLFEALRRHALKQAHPNWAAGARFYAVDREEPTRLDLYRARVVDGLGHTVHERLFALEIGANGDAQLREPSILGDLTPATAPEDLPPVASTSEATDTLNRLALHPFLDEVREERVAEIERIAAHVDTSLTELLAKADEEIGRAQEDKEQGIAGAEGRLAQAENRHGDLLARRERRRDELSRQRALTLQGVERLASVLVLPHPERHAPEIAGLRPNPETERIAMEIVINHERSLGRQVFDVSDKNLGYDVTSLDLESGELRLIEVKGSAGDTGVIRLTPNEKRVAEDRRDCYWLYVGICATMMPTTLSLLFFLR